MLEVLKMAFGDLCEVKLETTAQARGQGHQFHVRQGQEISADHLEVKTEHLIIPKLQLFLSQAECDNTCKAHPSTGARTLHP